MRLMHIVDGESKEGMLEAGDVCKNFYREPRLMNPVLSCEHGGRAGRELGRIERFEA